MKIDVSAGLTNFDGQPIFDSAESRVAVTLKQVLIMACLAANSQKHNNGEKKYKIYSLLKRVSDAAGALELAAEEVTLLKDLVGDICSVAVVGPVFDLLEGK